MQPNLLFKYNNITFLKGAKVIIKSVTGEVYYNQKFPANLSQGSNFMF